jgi:hypothetical protein
VCSSAKEDVGRKGAEGLISPGHKTPVRPEAAAFKLLLAVIAFVVPCEKMTSERFGIAASGGDLAFSHSHWLTAVLMQFYLNADRPGDPAFR